MYRFVRICGKWNDNNGGRCHPACDHLHVCRDWLVGECSTGPNCPRGHSFDSTPVARLPFGNWCDDELRRFVRECHSNVCADYNSPAGCHRQCNRLHLCNEHLLLRCCGYCTRIHDTDFVGCFPMYKRYGLQDLSLSKDLFRWLLMPFVNGLSETAASTVAFPTVEPLPTELCNNYTSASCTSTCSNSTTVGDSLTSSKSLLYVRKSRDGNSTDFKLVQPSASPIPKSECNSGFGNKLSSELFSTVAQVPRPAASSRGQTVSETAEKSLKPPDGIATNSKGSSTREPDSAACAAREPYICEKMLRGVCEKGSLCELYHIEAPFTPAMFANVDASAATLPADETIVPINYLWQYRHGRSSIEPPEARAYPKF